MKGVKQDTKSNQAQKVKQFVKQNGEVTCRPEDRGAVLASNNGASDRIRTYDKRFTKLSAIIPKHHFTFKSELLCKLPKTCFERKIPTGNNVFYSVY